MIRVFIQPFDGPVQRPAIDGVPISLEFGNNELFLFALHINGAN